MSHVPIVQGVAVTSEQSKYENSPYNPSSDYGQQYQNTADFNATTLSDQELRELRQNPKKQFQDVAFAIAFWLHLIVMLVFIGLGLSSGGEGGYQSGSYSPIIFMVGATGLTALGLSSLALSFMMNNAETLVQTALIFSVLSSLAVGIVGFMMGSMMMGIMGMVFFAIGICYARIVWPRIPFAASNLKTALTAVRQNLGAAVIAYGLTAIAFVWTLLWFFGVGDSLSNNKLPIVFLFFLSYYWVQQVLQNTIHVTVAGVVGTWWFVPDEASTCCSRALMDSFFRATTYSFGSICFGSLLVATVKALRALEYYARDSDDMQFLVCIIQCILACIESILEYLNQWAYVYVGLYGFSYLEAAKNVITLFQNKGWTAIITDDLCDNVMFMISVAIGLASGLLGLLLGTLDSGMFEALGFEHAGGPGFVIGFLTGFLFASILMSVVSSAVNTVIVCYAEAPAEFQMNHPQLASDMRQAWVQAWPGLSF